MYNVYKLRFMKNDMIRVLILYAYKEKYRFGFRIHASTKLKTGSFLLIK